MSTAKRNIVYLYSEVMPYAIAVMQALHKEYQAQVYCVFWDQNKKTPFVPTDSEGITFYRRSAFDDNELREFLVSLHPDAVYVSGRMDKGYLKAVAKLKGKSLVISGLDTQWSGSLRDQLKSLGRGILYKRYFDYLWVPGPRQFKFARRLGYGEDHIISSVLSADTDIFFSAFQGKAPGNGHFPHSFVFVGRFANEKGIDLLLKAFTELKKERPNDWKLVLVGSGSLDESFVACQDIEVNNFMTAGELAEKSKSWGVFCLPSTYEPWGVVVHEFAAAGLPLVCSDSVGAADVFLKDGYNGFIFQNGDVASLKQALTRIINAGDDELWKMSARSYEMAHIITPEKSAASLMSIFSKSNKAK